MYHGTVSSQPSLGGTYTGIEPTGLLWSVVPEEKHRHKNQRQVKTDTSIPWKYKISMMDIDVPTNKDESSPVMDSVEIERHFVAPWVQTSPVERGELRGTLYIPRKDGKVGSLFATQ